MDRKWTLVWSDEFDDGESPDPLKWTYEVGMVRNGEAQFYTRSQPRNARLEGGALVLQAHPGGWEGQGRYTSASLKTQGLGAWQYGRIEARCKLPAARGSWPALWMMPAGEGLPWPAAGEIDIMEHVGHRPGQIHGTVHYGRESHRQKGRFLQVPDFADAYHVYAIEWSAGQIAWYVDGTCYHILTRSDVEAEAEPWPFDKPFFLLAGLAVGGNWGGEEGIDEAAFPQQFLIDYIRIFRRAEEAFSA
jgi:beta-glucanase (GH16 family)